MSTSIDGPYSIAQFTDALCRNFDIYLDSAYFYRTNLNKRVLATNSKEDAVAAYKATVQEFHSNVYFEIQEDYMRVKRHEDLIERWEKAGSNQRRREALERLIVNFDMNNYAGPLPTVFNR